MKEEWRCGEVISALDVVSALVSVVMLFPKKRNFAPHCVSTARCINGYW